MNMYKHGPYSSYGNDVLTDVDTYDAGLVYIGVAPINLVKGYSSQNVNSPITIKNMLEAKKTLGYSSNWECFSLCEAMKAHFGNDNGNIGPVHFINVLDPSVHIKSDEVTGTLTFEKRRATITDPLMIVDSFNLVGKTEGADYSVKYDMELEALIVEDISTDGIESNGYRYSQVDLTTNKMVSAVIGSNDTQTGKVTGINALKLVYENCNVIPKKVLAPGYSHLPTVKEKLKAVSQSINGRFVAQTYVDIPLEDKDGQAIDTDEKAIAWANENNYNNVFSKNFYPMIIDGGEKYHLSTKFAVAQMIVDLKNDGIPYETASNKAINADKLYFGKSAINSGFDMENANSLNSKGITTAVKWAGNWRLWGGHTAAYDFDKENELGKEIFDTSVAMQIYLVDDFILECSTEIDTPMTVSLMQSIINEVQNKLDNLVSIGALQGNPKFVADDISSNEIKAGSYHFELDNTPTSQLKDVTIKVVYTDKGYSALLGGTDNEEE